MAPYKKALDVVGSASTQLVLVAPFIKLPALRKILQQRAPTLDSLTCVTRWLPLDIASGVCDLEILEYIEEECQGQLFVHPQLHAKYYRGDQRCLLGSANVSGRGLGITTPPNLELLVEVPFAFGDLRDWERRLLDASVPATAELQDELRREAGRLSDEGLALPSGVDDVGDTESLPEEWVPTCPVPAYLWDVYAGEGEANLTKTGFRTAEADLASLAVPTGLSTQLFHAFVASTLKEMPLIAEIDGLASEGLLDAQAISLLQERLGANAPYSPEQSWRVIKDWLVFFFGSTYRLEVGQEVLVKGREISGS